MFNFIGPEHIAVMIPVIAMFGAVIIIIVAIVVGGRNKELLHKERILSLEKGLPIPDEKPVKIEKPGYTGKRTAGIVFLAIGLAVTIANWVVAGAVGGVWGLIPLFIGIGLLIAAALDKKEYIEQEEKARIR